MNELINSNDIFIKKNLSEFIFESVKYIINSLTLENNENISTKMHK